MQDPKDTGTGGVGILVRLYWMVFGNVILWFLMACIFSKRPKLPSAYDAVYWLVVVSLLLARYVDIRYFKGFTAYSEVPATFAHWRRYVVLLVVGGIGVWLGAHALGRLLG